MTKGGSQLRVMEKIEEFKNIREFFDHFKRRKQKIRVMDNLPSVNTLIRLKTLKQAYVMTYGDESEAVQKISKLTDVIIDNKEEYSISIDGQGRKEFMKVLSNPRTPEEEEKNKDMIDKLADAIG